MKIALPQETQQGAGFWLAVIVVWLAAWFGVDMLAKRRFSKVMSERLVGLLIPLLFGIWLLILWQLITTGFTIPKVHVFIKSSKT